MRPFLTLTLLLAPLAGSAPAQEAGHCDAARAKAQTEACARAEAGAAIVTSSQAPAPHPRGWCERMAAGSRSGGGCAEAARVGGRKAGSCATTPKAAAHRAASSCQDAQEPSPCDKASSAHPEAKAACDPDAARTAAVAIRACEPDEPAGACDRDTPETIRSFQVAAAAAPQACNQDPDEECGGEEECTAEGEGEGDDCDQPCDDCAGAKSAAIAIEIGEADPHQLVWIQQDDECETECGEGAPRRGRQTHVLRLHDGGPGGLLRLRKVEDEPACAPVAPSCEDCDDEDDCDGACDGDQVCEDDDPCEVTREYEVIFLGDEGPMVGRMLAEGPAGGRFAAPHCEEEGERCEEACEGGCCGCCAQAKKGRAWKMAEAKMWAAKKRMAWKAARRRAWAGRGWTAGDKRVGSLRHRRNGPRCGDGPNLAPHPPHDAPPPFFRGRGPAPFGRPMPPAERGGRMKIRMRGLMVGPDGQARRFGDWGDDDCRIEIECEESCERGRCEAECDQGSCEEKECGSACDRGSCDEEECEQECDEGCEQEECEVQAPRRGDVTMLFRPPAEPEHHPRPEVQGGITEPLEVLGYATLATEDAARRDRIEALERRIVELEAQLTRIENMLEAIARG
ncbi:MAG: hypothetical protein D6702_04670 [Planctomycetota bacterium]|nr:MAG: hypothetical protein D6702_04670 [Planctomycetota bacterium]